MLQSINLSHSFYAIYMDLPSDRSIQIGKLGTFTFIKGTYIYVGSAKRNIKARVNRHLKKDKPFKWHIDYLRPHCEVIKIITYENSFTECFLAEKIRKENHGTFPVHKFGATDCKCFSHLILTND